MYQLTLVSTETIWIKAKQNKIVQSENVYYRAHSHCAIFFDCDCDSSYCNKWVVQDSMEVFTLCDFDNITNSYVARYKQKQIAVAIRKNAQCE